MANRVFSKFSCKDTFSCKDIIKIGHQPFYILDFLTSSNQAVVRPLTENYHFVKKPNCFSNITYIELNQPFTVVKRNVLQKDIQSVSWNFAEPDLDISSLCEDYDTA